ncbi:unnamed protein product [Boreogadus saida]
MSAVAALESEVGNPNAAVFGCMIEFRSGQDHFYLVYGDTPRHTPILENVAHSRGSAEVLEWQEVSGRARLSAYQRDSLLRVAELHHRKF